MKPPVPLYPFAAFKRYQMPEGFSIRLAFLGTGYEFLILEKDCPEFFALRELVLKDPKALPITFDTPEKHYQIDFIHGDGTLKVIEFHGTRALYSPQVTFKTADTLTHIDNHHTWEILINEAKKETNKEETNKEKAW